MKFITEPKVFLAGRLIVNQEAMAEFLNDHMVSWETDAGTAAEYLVESAGRICYMSFAKPRPGGNKAYIDHILEVGHGCYDAETDVLCESGWKRWDDVTKEDRLATRNAAGMIEYQAPTALIAKPYCGEMYRVEGGRGVDLLVTPNHRMYVAQVTTKKDRSKPVFGFVSASDLDGRNCRYIKTGIWKESDEQPASGPWFELLGFAIGDGSMDVKGRRLKFRLRRERKIAYLHKTAAACGLEVSSKGDRFTVRLCDQWLGIFREIYGPDREKVIPQRLLISLGSGNLLALYRGLMASDGSEWKNAAIYDTTSKVLAGQFQQLCLHIGMAANISMAPCYSTREKSFGSKPVSRLGILDDCGTMPEVNRTKSYKAKSSWVDGWSGMVYCAEVPNGTLYVRRNGKPVWCGNSVIEHAVWNIIVTGVSRSLSHELVRHRAGMSPSQLSQRYVDESVAEYVVPPDLMEEVAAAERLFREHWANPQFDVDECEVLLGKQHHLTAAERTGVQWFSAIAHAQLAYGRLSNYLTTKADLAGLEKTEARKFARQAARSVLPNATETKLFLTFNARAMRHFIEMRASRFADVEIRQLAVKLYDLMVVEAPVLFGDYTKTELPDGTFEVTTTHRKV